MKVSKIRLFFGYRYVLNTKTQEVHNLKNIKTRCRIPLLVNYKYLTKRQMLKAIKSGANGCRFCCKELDEG